LWGGRKEREKGGKLTEEKTKGKENKERERTEDGGLREERAKGGMFMGEETNGRKTKREYLDLKTEDWGKRGRGGEGGQPEGSRNWRKGRAERRPKGWRLREDVLRRGNA
jgi:hypothetical protein